MGPHAATLVASSIDGSSAPLHSLPHADSHSASASDLKASFTPGPPVLRAPGDPAFGLGHLHIPGQIPLQAHVPQAAPAFPAVHVPMMAPTIPAVTPAAPSPAVHVLMMAPTIPAVTPAAPSPPAVAPPMPALPPLPPAAPTVARVELLKLDPIKDAKAFLDSFETIQYYLQMPEFSTRHADGSLSTDAANLDASCVWEGQLCLAVKDGALHFLFDNKGTQYHGRGFEMLAALTQHYRPDTVSNAFASLLSLFNDVQGESEPILEYRSRFDGLTQELSRCKVVLPHLLSVMLFLCALHICYADIIEQSCTHFKSIKTTSIESIVSDVAYQDGFKLVDSKKGKPGAGPSPRMPTTAAANTDCQGQVWQSPFKWLTKYGLKGIENCWTRAMAGTGICPICHCDEQLCHVPTKCPLLTELNLKLIVCRPARPSPATAAPASAKADPAGTPSPAPNPGGRAASTNTGSGSGLAGSVAAPSGLTAAVAPVLDKEEEYDTDEEFTWDGNETVFGDLDHNLTKSVGLYPLPWLGKLPTCWRHVGLTAKCRHFWPTSPCRGDTKPIPTQYFCVGDCRHSPNLYFSTRATY
jgi:hypothetical protein